MEDSERDTERSKSKPEIRAPAIGQLIDQSIERKLAASYFNNRWLVPVKVKNVTFTSSVSGFAAFEASGFGMLVGQKKQPEDATLDSGKQTFLHFIDQSINQ